VKDTHNGTRAQQQGQLEGPKAPQPNGDGVVGSCPTAGRGLRRVRAASIAGVMIVYQSPRSVAT
jgi:hypothetical protein